MNYPVVNFDSKTLTVYINDRRAKAPTNQLKQPTSQTNQLPDEPPDELTDATRHREPIHISKWLISN